MEDCNICYQSKKDFFVGSCNHSLCMGCFRQLKQNLCPFCRKEYNSDELVIKNYIYRANKYKSLPPLIQSYNLDQIRDYINRLDSIDDIELDIVPFSGYSRQMTRKRRKNLTFKQIQEKRKRIKKKQKIKWDRKNARLRKTRNCIF